MEVAKRFLGIPSLLGLIFVHNHPHMITLKNLEIQCNVHLGLKALTMHSQVVAYAI
jgi:hypothetical protein